MKTKTQVNELLSREVTRQEFFVLLGAAFLAIFGIKNIMQSLGNILDPGKRSEKSYSGSSYGGYKR